MSKFRHIARAATMAGIAVLVATSLSAAQEVWQSPPPVPKHSAAPQKRSAHGTMPAKPSATAQMPNQSALARMASSTADQEHRLILQVNTNDPAAMNLALNNAMNVTQHYKELGEKVEIEVITFGPGLHMLRDDTSPVKNEIRELRKLVPQVAFGACNNTKTAMEKREGKPVPIIAEATIVPAGVVRLVELQEAGYAYIKP
jgi:intracellular sulfur oxidation DsrE/DsrF family protein